MKDIKRILEGDFLRNKSELDTRSWVRAQGGEDSVREDNDKIKKAARVTASSESRRSTRDKPGQDEDNVARIRNELNTPPADAIKNNFDEFESRLGTKLSQLKDDIRREGDRIVLEFRKGAHDRLLNPVGPSSRYARLCILIICARRMFKDFGRNR